MSHDQQCCWLPVGNAALWPHSWRSLWHNIPDQWQGCKGPTLTMLQSVNRIAGCSQRWLRWDKYGILCCLACINLHEDGTYYMLDGYTGSTDHCSCSMYKQGYRNSWPLGKMLPCQPYLPPPNLCIAVCMKCWVLPGYPWPYATLHTCTTFSGQLGQYKRRYKPKLLFCMPVQTESIPKTNVWDILPITHTHKWQTWWKTLTVINTDNKSEFLASASRYKHNIHAF